MSWEEELFAYLEDLEGQAVALYDAERAPELADRSRAEYQQVTLASRLAASTDREITLELLGVGAVAGRLDRVARGWCLLHGPGQDWLIHLPAVAAAQGLSERALPEVAWPAVARLGLGAALRRLSDEAEPCSLHLTDGRRHDGTLLRVGADFVEVAAGAAGRVVVVGFIHLAAVQSRR
ncbi:MAG TPA: hypothetical protein DEQ43_04450 [Nocardioides bacterium]|uniref:hypothetical protein n=1 Tax=uncultured Nocardioides sp. TaxID=198441 RepID=UPI000EC0D778|nr:hypothetical protein [uncultured Nocardioides sp.]HCB03493.1 hypothetical protein [Nocardioides sp.]